MDAPATTTPPSLLSRHPGVVGVLNALMMGLTPGSLFVLASSSQSPAAKLLYVVATAAVLVVGTKIANRLSHHAGAGRTLSNAAYLILVAQIIGGLFGFYLLFATER